MTFTKEQSDELIAMYKAGLSYRQMKARTGLDYEKIAFYFCALAEKGIVELRPQSNDTFNRMREIREMVQKDKTRVEICDKLEIKPSTFSKYYNVLRKEGLVKPIKKARTVSYGCGIKVPSTLAPGEMVHCNHKISRTCVYGSLNTHDGLCRYALVTGECRSLGPEGCDYTACTRYSKISQNNPRITLR